MKGQIGIYNKNKNLIYFSSNKNSNTSIVFISGMYGGLFEPGYTKEIYKMCRKKQINFFQPRLSSFPNFGLFTLENDALEVLESLKYNQSENIILIGHSTGCQVIMYLIENYGEDFKERVKICILHGPISDRNYEEHVNRDLPKIIKEVTNKSESEVFVYENTMYKKERFLDLYRIGGKDDFFSYDLENTFFENLNKIEFKILFIISGNDKFTKESNLNKLKLIKGGEVKIIKEADHFLKQKKYIKKFLNIITKKISRLEKNNLSNL
ncbi:DUF1749 domain-containing protein [Hamiltosporidium tvaerminnensis]|uniref:DUF1749 domain-containing protein n=1 Tax=Hamiltosporidium tvaerminnensis TaxID=1176355 RepID=A0A4Q9KWL8_9MICR|nr:DUF1749 domain-containing protein [Hamiltosporidium tvaerminnensis]